MMTMLLIHHDIHNVEMVPSSINLFFIFIKMMLYIVLF